MYDSVAMTYNEGQNPPFLRCTSEFLGKYTLQDLFITFEMNAIKKKNCMLSYNYSCSHIYVLHYAE